MLIHKAFALVAISYISTASAYNLDSILHSDTGNGNFIIQLNQTACIKHFVPQFIDNAFQVFAQSVGNSHLAKRGNKIVRRDTEEEQVHVFDAYDIGDSFKGITVSFQNLDIVKSLIFSFTNNEIVQIIPDEDFTFDLPTSPKTVHQKRKLASRGAASHRIGNFDLDNYEHDKDSSNKFSSQYVSQDNATWNLVRTSQHERKLSDPYIYPSSAGSSAYVYIIDDGMKTDHDEFEGRASWGYSTYSGVSRLGEGHGTHVGGIIAGKTYGIAKKANLIAVQVLDESGSGSLSSLLAGIQWVSKNAAKHKGKAIINMSLGLKTNGKLDSSLKAFDKAVTAVVKSGVPVIAAAGNWGNNACDVLPAGNANVLAVGAIDNADTMGDYSSYGKCVSILAPGSKITSAFIKSDTSTTTLTGTSMAAPHAAGVAALFVDKLGKPTPTALYKAIKDAGTKNAAKSVVSNTPNLVLFNGQESS
ncbi:peptidase S8/S53 domain-containing protein [Choanephora cucurbitarum]|nr:peptidase S8/S53 domain-containing protein [Choanephora cucurbitarum]